MLAAPTPAIHTKGAENHEANGEDVTRKVVQPARLHIQQLMNATTAIEEKVHRDAGQQAIVLVVCHNCDLNALSIFLDFEASLEKKLQ